MPVKLPGKEALGGPSTISSGRSIISGSDYGAGTVARGLQGVGATVSAIDEDMRKQEDALDLIRADTEFQEGLSATRRGFETDTDYKTYGPRFDEKVSPIAEGAASKIRNPHSRAKWIERAKGQATASRESVLNRGLSLEREHKEVEVENIASRRAGDYASTRDPGERLAILNDTIDKIKAAEATGLIRPKRAEEFRDRFIDGTIQLDIEERLYDDPEGVLKDLGVVPGGKPLARPSSEAGPLPKSYIEEIKKSEGFTPRAAWDYKQHSIGYGTRGKPGETIDKAEADRRLNDELGKAAAIVDKFAPGLDEGTRAALVSLTFNAGDDWTRQGLGKAIKAGDLARAKSLFVEYKKAGGETLPGLVARRQREVQWIGAGEQRGLTRYAGLPQTSDVTREELPPPGEAAKEPDDGTGVLQFGEPETPSADPDSPTRAQYAMMSGKRRQVMIGKARIALSHKYQQRLANDIARLEEGEEEEVDERGETNFDRAARVLQPNVLAQWKTKREKAVLKRDSLKPLADLPEDQVDEHIRSIGRDPRTGAEREDLGFANIRAVRSQAEKEWEKIREQRRKDPAAAVSKSPEVVRSIAAMQGKPGAVGIGIDEFGEPTIDRANLTPTQQRAAATQIVEASLAAQERLGISRSNQRTISKRQAEKLLDMRNPSELSPQQQRDALSAAAERANKLFGPEMGERVFRDALVLSFHPNADDLRGYVNRGRGAFRESAEAEERFQLIAKQAFGRSITTKDMDRLEQLKRLDAMPSVLPEPGTGMNSGAPYIGQPYQSPVTPPRQPNERQSALLLQQLGADPSKAQKYREDFDAKFGDGAAARVINKLMSGEPDPR